MTLEDFFTLTEMKNGLTTLGRVEDLVSMLQKQKDFVLTNVGDAARQWSTVASTLAATENEDCLIHFVQLDGLFFLNQWLQEALGHRIDLADSAVEELFNALLGSLERLPVDREKFDASGIRITVEQLFGYKILNINERARALFERWNHATAVITASDCSYKSVEEGEKCEDKPNPSSDVNMVDGMHSILDVAPSNKTSKDGDFGIKSAGTESHHSPITRHSESSRLDADGNEKTSTPITEENVNLGEKNSSIVSNSSQENFSMTRELPVYPTVVMASTGTSCCPSASGGDADEHSIASSSKMEHSIASSSFGLSASSPARKPERTVSCNIDSKENTSCISETIEPLPRSVSVDCVVPKYLRDMELKPTMQDLLSSRCKQRKGDGPKVSFNGKEAVGSDLHSKSNFNLCKVEPVIPDDSSEMEIKLAGQRSELGLEDGEIDALEVARQVAIEVEREVVDYREPFCSSSPEVSSGELVGAQSNDIVKDKQELPVDSDMQEQAVDSDMQEQPGDSDMQEQPGDSDMQEQPVNEELNDNGSLTGNDLSNCASPPKENNSIISETEIYPEKCDEDLASPKPTTTDEGSGGKTDQKFCDFDLNEDVCTEEFDCSTNPILNSSVSVSAPIAVVAASKGALVLPVTPLRFEGELGWKGSAATSAFRPASPRRTPDGEKSYSGPKQKANFIEIDLNVAESGDDVVVDPTSSKQVPVSSGFPSRDSSIEVSSKRAERLNLDLNRLGDEDVSAQPSSYWRLPLQNGDQPLSPASSSSSRQPSMRDFDLNDNPCFFDAGVSHNLTKSSSKASGTYGSSKLDDPVITLMGSRLAVERKDYASHAQPSFMGSRPSVESAMAGRPMLPYTHIPPAAYGYNGIGAGPAMPFAQQLPQTIYGSGSIPYMVDSRGATVIPQILGSPGLSGGTSTAPPFFMSVSSAPSGLNGAGPSQPGLDLNSGMLLMESGSREAGGLKHLFMQGPGGLIEEPAKTASQHAVASGMSLKRKEPDSGWEPYAFGYKQVTSWQ